MLFMPDLSSHHSNENELIKRIFCGFVRTKSLSKGGHLWVCMQGTLWVVEESYLLKNF